MATKAQLSERLAKSSELLRLALLGAADSKEWREKYDELQSLALRHATQSGGVGDADAAQQARKILLGAVHCDTRYTSGHDVIEVNFDHFHRLCDARNAAIRLLSGEP